jgi:hypothetical protein
VKTYILENLMVKGGQIKVTEAEVIARYADILNTLDAASKENICYHIGNYRPTPIQFFEGYLKVYGSQCVGYLWGQINPHLLRWGRTR